MGGPDTAGCGLCTLDRAENSAEAPPLRPNLSVEPLCLRGAPVEALRAAFRHGWAGGGL